MTILRLLIPRLAKTAQRQADARSLMTGRITDAYSNIATVKLFSHDAREANYAKRSMEEFMVTVHAQMRLGSSLDTLTLCNQYFLNVKHRDFRRGVVAKRSSRCGSSSYSNRDGVTCKWSFSLDYVGISSFIWKYRDSDDGMATLTKPHTIVDKPNCVALEVKQGEIKI